MRKSDLAKLMISVVLDVLDFTIGRIPGFEFAFDAFLTAAAVAMWGWAGLFAIWEIADPTGQADSFVPTMTLIAISQLGKAKKKAAAPELPRA
jgi:hypothetical protein